MLSMNGFVIKSILKPGKAKPTTAKSNQASGSSVSENPIDLKNAEASKSGSKFKNVNKLTSLTKSEKPNPNQLPTKLRNGFVVKNIVNELTNRALNDPIKRSETSDSAVNPRKRVGTTLKDAGLRDFTSLDEVTDNSQKFTPGTNVKRGNSKVFNSGNARGLPGSKRRNNSGKVGATEPSSASNMKEIALSNGLVVKVNKEVAAGVLKKSDASEQKASVNAIKTSKEQLQRKIRPVKGTVLHKKTVVKPKKVVQRVPHKNKASESIDPLSEHNTIVAGNLENAAGEDSHSQNIAKSAHVSKKQKYMSEVKNTDPNTGPQGVNISTPISPNQPNITSTENTVLTKEPLEVSIQAVITKNPESGQLQRNIEVPSNPILGNNRLHTIPDANREETSHVQSNMDMYKQPPDGSISAENCELDDQPSNNISHRPINNLDALLQSLSASKEQLNPLIRNRYSLLQKSRRNSNHPRSPYSRLANDKALGYTPKKQRYSVITSQYGLGGVQAQQGLSVTKGAVPDDLAQISLGANAVELNGFPAIGNDVPGDDLPISHDKNVGVQKVLSVTGDTVPKDHPQNSHMPGRTSNVRQNASKSSNDPLGLESKQVIIENSQEYRNMGVKRLENSISQQSISPNYQLAAHPNKTENLPSPDTQFSNTANRALSLINENLPLSQQIQKVLLPFLNLKNPIIQEFRNALLKTKIQKSNLFFETSLREYEKGHLEYTAYIHQKNNQLSVWKGVYTKVLEKNTQVFVEKFDYENDLKIFIKKEQTRTISAFEKIQKVNENRIAKLHRILLSIEDCTKEFRNKRVRVCHFLVRKCIESRVEPVVLLKAMCTGVRKV